MQKKALFPVFARYRDARGSNGWRSRCAKTPRKQGSTHTDDVSLTRCFHSFAATDAVRAVRVATSAFVDGETRDELVLSAGGCTNDNILVPAGQPACQNKRCNRQRELSREYAHQAFVSFTIDWCGRHAHLQASRANAANAFRGRAWPNAQTKNEVCAVDRAPVLLAQRSRMSSA